MTGLNQRAENLSTRVFPAVADELRIQRNAVSGGGEWWDFGLETEGGLEAGRLLAFACMSELGTIGFETAAIGDVPWPHVQVQTDHPTEACLLSQYAGWRVSVGDFFGMLSGPIRAVAAREDLFERLKHVEKSRHAVGVLETEHAPVREVFEELAEKSGLPAAKISLFVAPTSSQAGTVQIVARSVETAMHKLYELGFDVWRVRSGFGIAPLPPSGADFLTSLGRTNDAILYGARVHLWVKGDPAEIKAIGPKVPSQTSEAHGRPFREIFEAAGGDFYKIDPLLFSPAEVVFNSLETGEVFRFGDVSPDVIKQSFGI